MRRRDGRSRHLARSVEAGHPEFQHHRHHARDFKLAITETPRQFTTVFDTGAKAVGDAGTVAADALARRAGGIGSTLGNAAADAIIARVSNMPINVNVNVNNKSGPDTGAQKTAGD